MNEHADLELIAAFHEGLLDRAAGDRLARHLSGCAVCTQRQAALDDVTARLAAAPPPPLPPGLAERLDAALAAETDAARAEATGAPGSAATNASGPPRTGAGHSHRAGRPRARGEHAARAPAGGHAARRRADRARARRGLMADALRPLAVAASLIVLAGGGYLLVRSFAHSPSSSSSSAARGGAERASKSGGAITRLPLRQQAPAAAAAAADVISSGTNYQPGQLRAQAIAVAHRYAAAVGKAGTTVQPSRDNNSIAGCLQSVAGGRRGLIVDQATYQGRPATVIIFPATGGAGGLVWVVGPRCSASTSDIITSTGL